MRAGLCNIRTHAILVAVPLQPASPGEAILSPTNRLGSYLGDGWSWSRGFTKEWHGCPKAWHSVGAYWPRWIRTTILRSKV